METRLLGRTGLQVTPIGLGGAWLLKNSIGESLDAGAAIVRHALAHGINYIDTAECYGESECAIGLALEDYPGTVILATKFGHVPHNFDFSKESVLKSVERSRERLRYRPIDLLQLHTPAEPSWEQVQSALAGMREARERGWCRFLGITGRDIVFLQKCIDTDAFDTLLMFHRYDLLDQTGAALIHEAAERGVGVILGSPLRMGLFAGQHRRNELSTKEEQAIQAMEERFGPDGLLAAAMRFTWGNPEVATVLSGVGSLAELDHLLSLDRSPLSAEQIAHLCLFRS